MTIDAAAAGRLVAARARRRHRPAHAVSQVAVFGVPADLSPLLVGLGRLPRRLDRRAPCFGFALGLFMDTALAADARA